MAALATPAPPSEAPADPPDVRAVGRELVRAMPRLSRSPAAVAERRMMATLMERPELRAALFRFVDVRPACRTRADVARHLAELLAEADPEGAARLAGGLASSRAGRLPVALAASAAVRHTATRFIVGEDPAGALREIERLWRRGVATSVDLLGEATVTEAEADAYAARCQEALRTLTAAAATWPARPKLERDAAGAIPRVNLSVKVSALTPLLRPYAPERGIAGARARLREILRAARELGAHVHVDVESLDTRDSVVGLTTSLLSEPEFADGPSAGIVLQAYLVDSPRHLDELLAWNAAQGRTTPLTIRLVKGAYWDHEVVEARRNGWAPPVFTERAECDRNFEALSRRLIDESPRVRAAIASHNVRSIAHAAAYADARGRDVELQILRGLGDDVQDALAATGRRVRCYCPVGDLVAGMAYLVRRLLENTSNDSFLGARAMGEDLDSLLEAP